MCRDILDTAMKDGFRFGDGALCGRRGAVGGEERPGAYSARVKARPASASSAAPYFRVRQDRVDATGKVSLRYDSRLYKIGLGRAHKGRSSS
jgi:hypothetical protein